jgi:PD-(D/E)XK nuclease superfamily
METRVYNPWSILNFFSARAFENFWFETGTPTFLVNIMREKGVFTIPQEFVSIAQLNNFEFDNLQAATLLFQTGYATLTSYNAKDQTYFLDFPNNEVKLSLNQYLLDAFSGVSFGTGYPMVLKMRDALEENNLETLFSCFEVLFSSIPYQLWEDKKTENWYHSIVHISFLLLGNTLRSEVSTSNGRCDGLVETDTHIYAFEFKAKDSPETALQQIYDKGYLNAYKQSDKILVALGVSFRNIKEGKIDWVSGTI